MTFFQNSVLTKHLKAQDSAAIKTAYAKFSARFLDPVVQENIRNSKEEQYQGEFLIDLFVNVLGYTKHPAPDFNLTTENKNVKDDKGPLNYKSKSKPLVGRSIKWFMLCMG